jgi:hypothetical protein
MSLTWADLLIEDFRQQQINLQNQYQRMHNRLQLSMGLNTALLPAFGATAAAVGAGNLQAAWLSAFPITGILLSAVGYAAGRADRHLVELYRRQISRTARELLDLTGASKPYAEWAHSGRDTGDLRRLVEPVRKPDAGRQPRRSAWRTRATPRLSVTRLPYLLAIVFLCAWLTVLIALVIVAAASRLAGTF